MSRQIYTTGQSLALTFPLLVIYQFGIGFSGTIAALDLLSPAIWKFSGNEQIPYLALSAAALGTFFLYILLKPNYRSMLSAKHGLPMLLEAAIYALTLSSAIWLVMEKLIPMSINSSLIVSSAGSGIYEELLFRLIIFGGGFIVLAGNMKNQLAFVIALLVSSALFSLSHHFVIGSEVFTLSSFVYRLLTGIAFAVIFHYRSLAHAIYAHALYNVYAIGFFG